MIVPPLSAARLVWWVVVVGGLVVCELDSGREHRMMRVLAGSFFSVCVAGWGLVGVCVVHVDAIFLVFVVFVECL